VFRVVLDASLEVRSAVVYATFIVLWSSSRFDMTGLREFLRAAGLSYIIMIMASLGVALIVTRRFRSFLPVSPRSRLQRR
jgi:hypothetical protein